MCVPHSSTVLSKHGVGVEPLFCMDFWDRAVLAQGGGGGVNPQFGFSLGDILSQVGDKPGKGWPQGRAHGAHCPVRISISLKPLSLSRLARPSAYTPSPSIPVSPPPPPLPSLTTLCTNIPTAPISLPCPSFIPSF